MRLFTEILRLATTLVYLLAFYIAFEMVMEAMGVSFGEFVEMAGLGR